MSSDKLSRVEDLIKKGETVLTTEKPLPPNVIGFPTLDSGAFSEWKTQSISFIQSIFSSEHPYVLEFKENVKKGYSNQTKIGVGILRAVREELNIGIIVKDEDSDPIIYIEQICSKFHDMVRQLRDRYDNRQTIDVKDEYDVQDLFHATLRLFVDDVRVEENTPSYAGKSSRMDFLLKNEKIVIEVKKTRAGLAGKEVGSQLIEDIERYKVHPDCEILICFVYDPEGLIANPRGLEADLKRDDSPFPVRVFIRPI